MKTGIITFHCAPSYGALLQAFALRQVLARLGHDPLVLDYLPAHRRESLDRLRYVRTWSWRRAGLNGENRLYLRGRRLFPRAARTLCRPGPRYTSLEALRRNPPVLAACVAGSDQIWNPVHTGGSYDPAYFCGFGPPGMRRIAYGASFGGLPDSDGEAVLAGLLSGLDSVSVRESPGVEIVRRLCGKEAAWVLDPTLLLDPGGYPPVRQPPLIGSGYILAYPMQPTAWFDQCVSAMSNRLRLPVVSIANPADFPKYRYPPDPFEFLDLLRGARHVVTNSYHGVCLAIVHRIPFTAVGLAGGNRAWILRLTDLLARLGLSDRLADGELPAAFSSPDFFEPDWTACEGVLQQAREVSRDFLVRALPGSGLASPRTNR